MKTAAMLAVLCLTILSSPEEVSSIAIPDFYHPFPDSTPSVPFGYFDQFSFSAPNYNLFRNNMMRPMYPYPPPILPMVPVPSPLSLPIDLRAPFPTDVAEEAKEEEAIIQLENLKRLYEDQQYTNGEERFLLPSISFSSNSVTLSTTSFLSLLK